LISKVDSIRYKLRNDGNILEIVGKRYLVYGKNSGINISKNIDLSKKMFETKVIGC